MSTLSQNAVRVSLADCDDLTRDEAQLIRDWLMRDEPAFDEAPTADEAYQPTDSDARWWARLSSTFEPSDLDLWLPDDREAALPELSDDRADACAGWSEEAQW